MKQLTTFVLSSALFVVPVVALAQSSPSPENTAGPGVSTTAPAPTDMGMGNESGNVWGFPSRQIETTGSAIYEAPIAGDYGNYGMRETRPGTGSMRRPNEE